MIVRQKPNFWGLLYVLRGSILQQVAPHVLGVAAVSTAVVLFQRHNPSAFLTFSPAPFTLLGLALSIFLGFRNGACYERWWEGRRQWGQLIFEMRSFARLIVAMFPEDADREYRVGLLRSAIGFAQTLNARLRGEDEEEAVARWQEPVRTSGASHNMPDAFLTHIMISLASRGRNGSLSDIQFQIFETHLSAMTSVLAACERLRGAPLPFAYSLLLHRTAYLFCAFVPFGLANSLGWATPLLAGAIAYTFFGLDALGNELAEPFVRAHNGLPLDAMTRTVEIDLLSAAGEPVPQPVQPERYVLL